MPSPGLAFLAIALSGYLLAPAETPDAGRRAESDSYTAPGEIARCITYNISRKMPQLHVRHGANGNSGESIFLILRNSEPAPGMFGVIRVDPRESGSHLTTWLADRSLSAAPDELARKLIAGC